MSASARLFYVLADTSGSTSRNGFNAGWNQALPRLVTAAEEVVGAECRMCLMTYGSDAALQVPLTGTRDVTMLPWVPPAGLSSLAAGLRLLARTVREDRELLVFDGITVEAAVALVVADGLATDPDDQVLAARDVLADECALHIAFPGDEDELAFAGLRATRHPLRAGDADRVADSIVQAARATLGR